MYIDSDGYGGRGYFEHSPDDTPDISLARKLAFGISLGIFALAGADVLIKTVASVVEAFQNFH